MNELLAELLKVVVIIIFAVGTYAVKVYLIPFIESKMSSEQLSTAQGLAKMFVYAAQQGLSEKTGEEKKKIVKEALISALQSEPFGIEVTEDFADDLIEAAVKGMKIAESGGVLEIEGVELEFGTGETDETDDAADPDAGTDDAGDPDSGTDETADPDAGTDDGADQDQEVEG